MSTFARRLLPAWLVGLVLFLPSTALAQFDAATVLGDVERRTGRRRPRRHRHAEEPGDRHLGQRRQRGQRGLPVPQRPHRHLQRRAPSCRASRSRKADDVTVTVNARQRVDLTMKVGSVGETVDGDRRRAAARDASRATAARSSASEQIVNLPLNGRAYADLALLSPGVRQSRDQHDSRDASFNVNGLRSAVNNFILDGVDNNSYGTSNQGFSNQVVQVSPDAVEEFKVQTNNFSAEYGRAGGAVINASMRSGTNAVPRHGWEFNRNTALNADRLLQADQRREAEADPQPVRRRLRRADRAQPHVLLRRLRRLPADPQARSTFASIPTLRAAPGHPRQADPRTRSPARSTPTASSRERDHRRSRRRCSAGLPDADAAPASPTTSTRCRGAPGLQRQGRRQGRSPVQQRA